MKIPFLRHRRSVSVRYTTMRRGRERKRMEYRLIAFSLFSTPGAAYATNREEIIFVTFSTLPVASRPVSYLFFFIRKLI